MRTTMLLYLALYAALHAAKERTLEKRPEYDLLPTCVENVIVNNASFHCVVDDIKNPRHIACDSESFKIFLKRGSTTDNCTTIHMVFPKEGR